VAFDARYRPAQREAGLGGHGPARVNRRWRGARRGRRQLPGEHPL